MALPRSSVIQLDDGQDAQSELQFQDFSLGVTSPDVATLSPSGSFSSYKEDLRDDENVDLLSTEKRKVPRFGNSVTTRAFDVDTDQVVQRIIWSMIPLPGRATFLDRQIRPKPDLYGPFWIAATLVFSTAISANIANYLRTEGQGAHLWSYDFHKVSLSATAVYSYTFLLPLILWGLMWYRQNTNRYTLLEMLCVYGYSLAIYVPISVLWVIQVAWFQWILVIIGAVLSGAVLLQTFWPTFRDENKKIAVVVLCLMLLFHTLLAVGFVTYFFRPSGNEVTVVTSMTSTSTSTTKDVDTPRPIKDKPIPTLDNKLKKMSLVLDEQSTAKVKTEKKLEIKDQIREIKKEAKKNISDIEKSAPILKPTNVLVNDLTSNKV